MSDSMDFFSMSMFGLFFFGFFCLFVFLSLLSDLLFYWQSKSRSGRIDKLQSIIGFGFVI